MKIIAENPAEEALLWRIKALSDELVNQDNRYTRMPVWTILDNNKAGKDYGAVMYFTGKPPSSISRKTVIITIIQRYVFAALTTTEN